MLFCRAEGQQSFFYVWTAQNFAQRNLQLKRKSSEKFAKFEIYRICIDRKYQGQDARKIFADWIVTNTKFWVISKLKKWTCARCEHEIGWLFCSKAETFNYEKQHKKENHEIVSFLLFISAQTRWQMIDMQNDNDNNSTAKVVDYTDKKY